MGSNSHQLWGMWELWCETPVTNRPGSNFKQTQSKQQGTTNAAVATKASWLDSVRSVGMFDTAEGFWGIHNCVITPSCLRVGESYMLFRYNIAPMWEHEANRRGGKWTMTFTPAENAAVDRCWLSLALACIGEQFPGEEEEICGVTVSKRKSGYKLSLWSRTANDEKVQKRIGFFIKVQLRLQSTQLNYMNHKETYAACPPSSGTSPTNKASPTPEEVRDPSPLPEDGGNSPHHPVIKPQYVL